MTIRKFAVSVVAAASLTAATQAAAAPRVAIAGVRNDPDGAVAAALAAAVCGPLECVSRGLVHAAGKIDFATARRNRVDGVLFGTVTDRSGRRFLALAFLRDSFTPEKTWSLPLDSKRQVRGGAAVAGDVVELLETSSRRVATRAAPAAAPRPAAVEGPARVTSAPSRGEPRSVVDAPRPERAGGRDLAAVDLGVAALQRKLSYSGVGASSAALMQFSGGTAVVPAIRAEVFPLGAEAGAWYAGLGAFGGYARSVGFRAKDDTTGLTHDSAYSALDVGIAYRFAPLGPGIRLVPALSYRSVSFQVKAKNGARVAGLPDTALTGVSAGIGVDVPVWARVTVLGDFSYTAWTHAGELVGTYFSKGSASALDVDAGVSIGLSGPFTFRVVGTLELDRYSLKGTSTYAATGATERYLGVRSAVRARF